MNYWQHAQFQFLQIYFNICVKERNIYKKKKKTCYLKIDVDIFSIILFMKKLNDSTDRQRLLYQQLFKTRASIYPINSFSVSMRLFISVFDISER